MLELKGDQFSGLNLASSSINTSDPEKSVFDGLDKTIHGVGALEGLPPSISKKEIEEIEALSEKLEQDYSPGNTAGTLKGLIDLRNRIGQVMGQLICFDGAATGSGRGTCDHLSAHERASMNKLEIYYSRKGPLIWEAISKARGISVDAIADRETITPDEEFLINVRVFLPDPANSKLESVVIEERGGLSVEPLEVIAPSANARADRPAWCVDQR